jgi:alpha-glucosidase (family GH31 glycosyl hydrolase)
MKKTISFWLTLATLFFASSMNAQDNSFEPTSEGILAKYGNEYIRIQLFNDSTVRVTKAFDTAMERVNYSIIAEPDAATAFTVAESDGIVTIQTAKLRIEYATATGSVTFFDAAGNQMLTEGSHSFSSTMDGSFSSYTLTQNFRLAADERIYGMGQVQDGQLNRRGTYVQLQQVNCTIAIPYYISSKNYGLYWDNYSPTTFSDTDGETYFRSTGKMIDYYVLAGSNAHEIQRSLRHMTGQTELPPLWNFGLYQSKERYVSANEVMDIVRQFRNLQIPLDCVVQDWMYWGDGWNAMEFLNPEFSNYQQMIDYVHQQNAKIMISFWPNFGDQTKPYAGFNSRGWLLNTSGNRPYNPYISEARDLYWDYIWKGVLSHGIDAYWMDATEPEDFTEDASPLNQVVIPGQTWRSLRNAYPLLTVSGVAEHHRAQSELADTRVSIMTRSAYLGMQRTGAYIWSADIDGNWATLRKQIPAACNVSETGLPYWNSDTGGFFLGDLNNASWRRLFLRWTQFSTFTPMLRFHGTSTAREPWRFGSAGDGRGEYDNIVKYIKFRYALLPYLYSTGHQVRTDAGTFMQALPLAFSDDAGTYNVSDEYMFGQNFLVAPVVDDGVIGRNVYLPQGQWIDFWTGYTIDGGQETYKITPLDLIPLYVPVGSILPIGPDVQYATEKKWDNLELRIYPGADGKFTLYEDKFDGYDYENGQYTEIPMTWNEATKTLTLGARRGSYDGMLTERTFNIVVVSPDKGKGDERATTFDATVTYTGEEVSIQLEAENVQEPIDEDAPINQPLVYPTNKVAAQPVTELEDGVEYAFQNANETLACRRFFWDWENLRTRAEGNIDDVRVVAEKNVVDGETFWAFRITSNDYNGRYLGRTNDRNVQIDNKRLWTATYEESNTAAGNGFVLRMKGDTTEGLSAMMMNGDGTWVVLWQYGNPGNDYTPMSNHWQFFRTDELSTEAINKYNAARLELYQYLREALQMYGRGIKSVVPAYNSGILTYNDDMATTDDVLAAIVALKAAIANSVSEYEPDEPATYGILNPSFENLSAQHEEEANSGVKPPFGWTLTRDGSEVRSDDGTWYWGAINSDGEYMDGSHLFGVWNGSGYGNIELSQTLTNLPEGRWQLSARLMRTEDFCRVRIFLNDEESDYPPVTTGDRNLSNVMTVTAETTDGTLRLGLRADAFFKSDDFRLTWLGDPTGIESEAWSVKSEENHFTTDSSRFTFYDLTSRRVALPTKGLYIVSGKKVLLK